MEAPKKSPISNGKMMGWSKLIYCSARNQLGCLGLVRGKIGNQPELVSIQLDS